MADKLDVIKSVPFVERENVGTSQEMSLLVCLLRDGEKLGYPKKCHNLCTYGMPLKSRAIPRKIYGDLLPDVTKSVTRFGPESGNRHVAKRVSPLRVNH